MAKRALMAPPRRGAGARRVQALAIAAIALIGIVSIASGLGVFGGGSKKLTPPPALFPDRALAPGARELAALRTRAHSLAAAWLRTHPGRDDAGFTAFALKSLPG